VNFGARSGPWLVSQRFDLAAFSAPAVVALALVPFGRWFDGGLPLPMWVVAVLAVDVAHVYATLFVTYLEPRGRKQFAPWLVGTPLVAFFASATALAVSGRLFWTLLAYTAVFHFVRQQVGWVALYQRREPDLGRLERALDRVAVYASTLYPLLWWHAHLPRRYHWFLPGDFVDGLVAPEVVEVLGLAYAGVLLGFFGVQAARLATGRRVAAGKVVVVATTAATWGVGILVTNTDWAFTLTNVLVHGVPYTAFVWHRCGGRVAGRSVSLGAFASLLVVFAYVEELAWDRLVWHDAATLFPGPALSLGEPWGRLAVAVLAVPQLTHYILDARIWRRPRGPGAGARTEGRNATHDMANASRPATAIQGGSGY